MSKRDNLHNLLRETKEASKHANNALLYAPSSLVFYLNKAATDLRLAERHIEREMEELPPELVHGVTCEKVEHLAAEGYSHDPGFDGEFTDDGVRYCGRCHHCI